jgi:WD40 repeat protein
MGQFGVQLRVFPPKHGRVWSVRWSPDGERIASSGEHNAVHIWDAASGALLITCDVGGPTVAAEWSPDGARLVTGGLPESGLGVWNPTTGAKVATYDVQGGISGVAYSPNGTRVAVAGELNLGQYEPMRVLIIELESGHITTVNTSHTGPQISDIAWSPDGALIATAGDTDSTTRVWRPENGAPVGIYTLPGYQPAVYAVAWSPNGARVVSGTSLGLHLYDVATGWLICQDLQQMPMWGVKWSPNGRWLGAISADGRPYLFNPATCKIIHGYTEQGRSRKGEQATSFAWAPDSRRIATGGSDGTIHIWEHTLD